MITLALLSLAYAQDAGGVVHTDIRASHGWLSPAVLVGFNPQPDPPRELRVDSTEASVSLPYVDRIGTGVVIGVAEERWGVREIWLEGRTPVLVYGAGAKETWLPPDPCMDLRVEFGDGTEMIVHLDIASSGGWIDPGTLVGFNPQPDPPKDFPAAVEISLDAYARGSATLDVTISLESGGQTLTLY